MRQLPGISQRTMNLVSISPSNFFGIYLQGTSKQGHADSMWSAGTAWIMTAACHQQKKWWMCSSFILNCQSTRQALKYPLYSSLICPSLPPPLKAVARSISCVQKNEFVKTCFFHKHPTVQGTLNTQNRPMVWFYSQLEEKEIKNLEIIIFFGNPGAPKRNPSHSGWEKKVRNKVIPT